MYTRGQGSQRDLRTCGDGGRAPWEPALECDGSVSHEVSTNKSQTFPFTTSYHRGTPKELTAGSVRITAPVSSQTVFILAPFPVNSYTHLQVTSPRGPRPDLCFRVPSRFPHTKQLRGCGWETRRRKREPSEGAPEVCAGTSNGIQSSVIPTCEVQSQHHRTLLALPVTLPSGLSSRSRGNSCSQHQGELNCGCLLTFPLAPFAKLLSSAFLLRPLFLHLSAITLARQGAGRSVPVRGPRHLLGNLTRERAFVFLGGALAADTTLRLLPSLHSSYHSSGCSPVTSITSAYPSQSEGSLT